MPENKPISVRYYPSLTDLVDSNKVPKFLHPFLFGDSTTTPPTEGILDKLYFRNLQFNRSSNGESASYNLDLITREKISYSLPGGVTFTLNGEGTEGLSAFPVSLQYEWALLSVLNDSEATEFSVFSVLELVDKACRILHLTGEELLANAFNLFVEPVNSNTTKYTQCANDINNEYSLGGTGNEINSSLTSLDALRLDIETKFASASIADGMTEVMYKVYLRNSGDQEAEKENFRKFFKLIAPNGIESYLKDILIPKFIVSLELSAGIELPRDWVLPLDNKIPIPESTVPGEEGTPRAAFTFATSKLTFDSAREEPLSIDADLSLSSDSYFGIGKTGLIAKFTRLKIDTSQNRSIPEITADGRSNTFIGVYIEECEIEFPPNWAIQNKQGSSEPPRILASNLILGSEGGVSGKFKVEGANEEYFVDGVIESIASIIVSVKSQSINVQVVDKNNKSKEETFSFYPGSRNYYLRDSKYNYFLIDSEGYVTKQSAPSGILKFKIGNKPIEDDNLSLSLDSFNVEIKQNKVINSSCVGFLTIPRTNQDPLVIQVTMTFDNGFLVKAVFPKEQPIVDNAFTTIKLKELELGSVNDAKHFGFAANAEIKQAWPFLDKFLPKKIDVEKFLYRSDDTLDYTVGLGWKSGTSITVSSDQPTEIVIPIHKDTSKNDKRILSIKALKVVAEKKENAPADPYLSLAATFIEAQLNIGNVRVELSDLGFESKVSFPADGGNFGPAEVDVDFIPPKSGKLFIDAGFIKGKGAIYYNEAEGSFDGVLELELTPKPKPDTDPNNPNPAAGAEKKESKGGIQLKGIVCLQTKMPDGSKGFSLLIILTAEFDEKPLGMGFTISGIGGLLGLNRTSNTEFLRNGLRTGALESILFPVDPVKNAQKIISDVKNGFPVAQDRFIIGPLLKLGWGKPTLIKIDLGLFIELPAPIVISLLGVARADLPKAAPGVESIVTIKLAFLAVLDFGKKQFSLDAAIYESTFKKAELSGDIAVRLWWGDNKLFLVTVGGFHPAFEVPPANLPTLRRLALTIRNDDKLKMWAQLYTAITSNTFQFGAELFLEAGDKYKAKARFWLDVLFRFNPFYFIANIGAEAGIYKGDKSLLSAYLSLSLEGPSPYRANGIAEFKVFGVAASVKFNKTFGDESNEQFLPQEIWSKIEAELNAHDAWEAILPENNNLLVTLKKVSGIQRFHPTGGIQISQKLAPSNFVLEKFGNTVPKDVKKFTFTGVDLDTGSGMESISYEPSMEDFAIADFKKMNDEEKLSAPSFVKMENGVITSGLIKVSAAYSLAFEASYELAVIDRDIRVVPVIPSLFEVTTTEYANDLAFSTAANSAFSSTNNRHGAERPDPVTISGPKYTVANTADLTSYESTPKWFNSPVEAEVYMKGIASGNPATLANMQVADNYELVI